MKQHMMTHKNRDGTPISADLLKSLERSRSSNNFRDGGNSKSNSSDDNVNDDSHKDGHSSSASSSVSPPKEHCLSLTIQHSRDGPLKAISPIDAPAANGHATSALLSANRSSSASAPFRSSAANKKRSSGTVVDSKRFNLWLFLFCPSGQHPPVLVLILCCFDPCGPVESVDRTLGKPACRCCRTTMANQMMD